MKSKTTKRQAQYIHAKKRALKRYGITFNKDMLKCIKDQIRTGDAILVQDKTNRLKIYIANISERKIPILWDAERLMVVTFLPKNLKEGDVI